MSKAHYAHVVDGIVINVSIWDGVTVVPRPDNVTIVPLPYVDKTDEDTGETVRRYTGGIGWDYVDGQFVDNRPVEEFDV